MKSSSAVKSIVMVMLCLFLIGVSTPSARGSNATFFVSGVVAATCVPGLCTTDPHPPGCNGLQHATIYVYVAGDFIPSDCGPDTACTCWNLLSGTQVNIYGKLYSSGEFTLNRITRIDVF